MNMNNRLYAERICRLQNYVNFGKFRSKSGVEIFPNRWPVWVLRSYSKKKHGGCRSRSGRKRNIWLQSPRARLASTVLPPSSDMRAPLQLQLIAKPLIPKPMPKAPQDPQIPRPKTPHRQPLTKNRTPGLAPHNDMCTSSRRNPFESWRHPQICILTCPLPDVA